MSKYSWELDFKTFSDKVKAIRSPQYCEDYFILGKRHQIGCHYYLYVDEDLNIINPYSKKNTGKKVLKSFVSTWSREDVFRQAYVWIICYASKNELYNARFYEITFRVYYKPQSGKYTEEVKYPFGLPYNGDNRCFFDNIRDEVGSNGTDIESIEFISQEIHY